MKSYEISSVIGEPPILIIDDDFTLREALAEILNLCLKVTVITAINGHRGLQVMQQQSVALVILDMNMPGMKGEQTYEQLQQIAPWVRVIISSSLSLGEAQSRFGKRKLPPYLQKPYDIDTLLKLVQEELASTQVDHTTSQALMVWADDGGAIG